MLVYKLGSEEGEARLSYILGRRADFNEGAMKAAEDIIAAVRNEGDDALFRYTKLYDGAEINPSNIRVTRREIDAAYEAIGGENNEGGLAGVIRRCRDRILSFHMRQRQNSWVSSDCFGGITGQMIRPLEAVGVYVPGGKAAYPSTVLMNVCPAKAAGVKRIVMCTPPCGDKGGVNPAILAAAHMAGADEIYKVGGAQAVAALAYGTKSVPRVDKIVGPGNAYVAMAKKAVFGAVGIDSVAGPSEILVIADETADPAYIAADMLSQAEHDEAASAILITTSRKLAGEVEAEIARQTEKLSRKNIIEKSIRDYGAVFVAGTMEEAVSAANFFAPEHLEVLTKTPQSVIPKITGAGAVFAGEYSPEPIGDYAAGPNHVLPTSGTARFFSPLSTDDFMKKTSIIALTKESFESMADDAAAFAQAEGLTAHAASVLIRKERGE